MEPPLFKGPPDKQNACWTDARVNVLLRGPKDEHGNLQVGLYLKGFHNVVILDGGGLTSTMTFSGTLCGSQAEGFSGVAVRIDAVASKDVDGYESVGAMYVHDFGFSEPVAEIAVDLWGSIALDATLRAHLEFAKKWGVNGAFLVLSVDMQVIESALAARLLGMGQVAGFRGFPVRSMRIDQKLTT